MLSVLLLCVNVDQRIENDTEASAKSGSLKKTFFPCYGVSINHKILKFIYKSAGNFKTHEKCEIYVINI